MGSFLNPGTIEFEEALNSEIYIDKSGLIEITNAVLRTQQKFMCISRPRRFGKSMAANMLSAYYSWYSFLSRTPESVWRNKNQHAGFFKLHAQCSWNAEKTAKIFNLWPAGTVSSCAAEGWNRFCTGYERCLFLY